jgi:hypothetical protein
MGDNRSTIGNFICDIIDALAGRGTSNGLYSLNMMHECNNDEYMI